MKRSLSIESPEVLQFKDGADIMYGPDQEWYGDPWKRQAGCGPTSCSALIWYLAKTREKCARLVDSDWAGTAGILKLMERVWEHVTPGAMGVNSTKILSSGAVSYGYERDISLKCDVLDIPRAGRRAGMDELSVFLTKRLAEDVPIAFLNLSNGKEKRLESWHWVILTGFDSTEGTGVVYDQSHKFEIDLKCWLETSILGGGFVSINLDGGEK